MRLQLNRKTFEARGNQLFVLVRLPVIMLGNKPSLETLVSRQWSTSELGKGINQLLTDMRAELPNDLDELKARQPWKISGIQFFQNMHRFEKTLRQLLTVQALEKELADLEAQQSAAMNLESFRSYYK